jgi:hypothetical protein
MRDCELTLPTFPAHVCVRLALQKGLRVADVARSTKDEAKGMGRIRLGCRSLTEARA